MDRAITFDEADDLYLGGGVVRGVESPWTTTAANNLLIQDIATFRDSAGLATWPADYSLRTTLDGRYYLERDAIRTAHTEDAEARLFPKRRSWWRYQALKGA